MKVLGKILLIVLSIPVFLLCILSINFRFQILKSGFFFNTFEKGNVYSQISDLLKDRLITKVTAGGGNVGDIGDLSSLISPRNLRIFVEVNVESILSYANGKSKELTLAVPLSVEKVSEGVDLKDFESTTRKMSFGDFLKEFNITALEKSDIKFISYLGTISWAAIGISFFLLILICIFIYLLTDEKKRLTPLGIMFLLLGGLTSILYFITGFLGRSLAGNVTENSGIGASFIAIVAPPFIENMIKIWILFGLMSIAFGVLLFFIKKPVYNK